MAATQATAPVLCRLRACVICPVLACVLVQPSGCLPRLPSAGYDSMKVDRLARKAAKKVCGVMLLVRVTG